MPNSLDIDGNRAVLRGRVTMETARSLFDEADALQQRFPQIVDFAGVDEVDSSAVALMLAWLRAAEARKTPLSFINLSPQLRSLTTLYGVADLIPTTPAA